MSVLRGLYKNSPSHGVPWTADRFGRIPNEKFIAIARTFDMVIESPQPFSINNRWNLLEALKKANPETKRIAHVMASLHPAGPDPTTYYGRMAAAFPREKRAKNAARQPTDFVDLIYDWSRLLDFWKSQISDQTFSDGSRAWDGGLFDMLLPNPGLGGLDFRAAGFTDAAAHVTAWRKSFDDLWARAQRIFPPGFELYGNTPGVFPAQAKGNLLEGWDDQAGGLEELLAAQAKGLCPRPLLFAAANNQGAPGPNGDPTSEPFLKRYRYVCSSAALTDGVAFMQPGEPEDGRHDWLDWDLPRYDLGEPKGNLYREGSAYRRQFERGKVTVVRDVVIGGKRYGVQEGWFCQ